VRCGLAAALLRQTATAGVHANPCSLARSPPGARARVGARRAPRDTCWLSRHGPAAPHAHAYQLDGKHIGLLVVVGVFSCPIISLPCARVQSNRGSRRSWHLLQDSRQQSSRTWKLTFARVARRRVIRTWTSEEQLALPSSERS
jgi:hypothetical protein